ncbi:MAG: tetratricopeptide repeat protein [Elusimicrobiaceae bacterium]|nr:tetratricopeptide repeat protein [Elusimicrobiaceae bacterium]
MRGPGLKLLFMGIAMLAAATAMWPSARNGFVWDDAHYILNNPLARDLSVGGLKRIFTEPHYGLYKPATILSFAVNHKFSGLDPAPYHLTNIFLHAVNSALVFLLVLLLTGDNGAAFLCALLFAVHPMHVESVAWISERKDMLYSLFFLLSSILYIKRAAGAGAAVSVFSIVCFGVSLTAKPMGIVLPAILFIYDYLLGRTFNRRLALEKTPYAAIAVLFGVWTYTLLRSANQFAQGFDPLDRVLFAFYGLKFYVWKLLYPARLSALYPFPLKTGNVLPLEYWLNPVTVLGCAALLFVYCRRNRAVMAGLAFYVIALLPALQLIPSGVAITADRYAYISSLGLFLPLSVYAAKYFEKLRARNARLAAVAAVCAALCVAGLAGLARGRCAVWKNDSTLFLDAARKHPSPGTLNALGAVLKSAGRLDDALKAFELAAESVGPVRPGTPAMRDFIASYINMADVLQAQGKAVIAEKMLQNIYNLSQAQAPRMIFLVLADIEAGKGNYQYAVELLGKAQADPAIRAEACSKTGDIYRRAGEYRKAAEAYRAALAVNPLAQGALSGLADTEGKTDGAGVIP